MQLPLNREELRQRWSDGEWFEFYLFYGHKPPDSGVDASCLSQWFERVFVIEGIQYKTAEHWMMAEKARLFNDMKMLEQILISSEPRDAKSFGRKVRGFDGEYWDQHKFEIVVSGNRAKFSQHTDLKQFLLSTANARPSARLSKVAESPAGYELNTDRKKATSESKDPSIPLRLGRDSNRPSQARKSAKLVPYSNSSVILVEAAGRDTTWGIGLGTKNPKSLNPMTWRGQNLLGFALTKVRDELARQRD